MHPPEPQPRQRRYSIRQQARLDAETHAKLETLANTFHRKRAQILRHVMQWGLAHTHEWTIDRSILARPHLVHMLVEPDLLQQVQDAAESYGVAVAVWLRQAMRQVTREDFPESWRAGEGGSRSHESGYDDQKLPFRLDAATQQKLETLMQTFHRSAAEIIRQVRPEDFLPSWHMAAMERRPPGVPLSDGGGDSVR